MMTVLINGFIDFLQNLLALSLEAAPWLVMGFVLGGLMKALIPTAFLQRHLSGDGIGSITKAAVLGAPLPLCSCGVIPAALGLRKAGASKPATASFLVSTPETGVDSISITYALMGPLMAVVRPVAALVSALSAGVLVALFDPEDKRKKNTEVVPCCGSEIPSVSPKPRLQSKACEPKGSALQQNQMSADESNSCCSTEVVQPTIAKTEEPASCCSSAASSAKPEPTRKQCHPTGE